MRTLISTLTGLSLLVAVFLAGGASLTADRVSSAAIRPLPLAAPFLAEVDSRAVRDTVRTPVSSSSRVPTPPNIDPRADQPLNQWFGCSPPDRGSICILRPTGVEALLPPEPSGVEDWRPLVQLFFAPSDVQRALDVMACESRGDRWAKNPTSTASGLFQHLASLWAPRAEAAGYHDADVFDPIANTAVAAWLVYDGGGWRHWNASRSCWR